LLRESSKAKGESFDLSVIVRKPRDGKGIDDERLADTQSRIRAAIGDAAPAQVSSWHTTSNRCGAKVRTRSERSGHAESVGSGLI
jgi:hypothetical protein